MTANGQLIGEGREIVARLPMPVQKFNSATIVESKYVCPAFAKRLVSSRFNLSNHKIKIKQWKI
jgi:hypothetical protein